MLRTASILLALLCTSSALAQVNDQLSISVDGTNVHVDVAGPNSRAPLLLFLHGGPGNVAFGLVAFRANVGRELEKNFLVAYLHQRGVGLSPQVPLETQTLANHVSDVNRVVEFLTRKYAQSTVVVVGHSWGGALAGLLANQHGEKIGQLVLIAAPMTMKQTLRESLNASLTWAKETQRSDALQELARIDPAFDTLEDFGLLNRWANEARGGVMRSIDIPAFIQANRINETYPNWQTLQVNVPRSMIPQLLTIDLERALPSFRWPALFVVGADDTIVPVQSVRHDCESYGGAKKLVVIEHSHHLPFMDQPQQLAAEIVGFLKER